MHWLDLILLIVLGFGAIMGARSGFVKQVARILTFLAAIYLCIFLHAPVERALLGKISGISPWGVKLLSYVVSFASVVVIGYLITWWIDKVIEAAQLKSIDRFLGAGLGALKAGLLCGVLLLGVTYFSGDDPPEDIKQSKIAPVVLKGMRVVLVAVPQEQKEKVNQTLDKLKKTAKEKAVESIDPMDPMNGKLPEIPGETGRDPLQKN